MTPTQKHIALVHYRLVYRGGLERRLYNYIHYLSKHGYRVTVLATKKDKSIKLPLNVSYQKVSIGPVPKRFRQWAFARKVKTILEQSYYDLTLSIGRTYGQDAILDGGNHTGYLAGLGITRKSYKDDINLHLDQYAYGESAVIFACSDMVRRYNISGYGTDGDKITVLHPPVDTEQFNTSVRNRRDTIRQRLGIADGPITFVFMSTGHKMKNLKFLLDLFYQLEDSKYQLLIAGTPPKRQLPDNVRYLGYVSDPEEVYAAVDYTIHPALYEPYGQVIAESIQCGTPVLVSSWVGAAEVVSNKEGIIIDSFDIDQWTEVIHGLKDRAFDIAPDFAERNGLTLEQHMTTLLDTCWRVVDT